MKLIYIAGALPSDVQLLIAGAGAMPVLPRPNIPASAQCVQSPSFWLQGTLELMRRCDALYLLPVLGMTPESTVAARRAAEDMGMTIFEHEDKGIQRLKEWLAYELEQARS